MIRLLRRLLRRGARHHAPRQLVDVAHLADAQRRIEAVEARADRIVPELAVHYQRNHFADRLRHTIAATKGPGHA